VRGRTLDIVVLNELLVGNVYGVGFLVFGDVWVGFGAPCWVWGVFHGDGGST